MKKFIFKSVLVQCILLLNGYPGQDCGVSSLMVENSIANTEGVKNIHAIVSNFDQEFKIGVAEIEEEKSRLISFNKYLTGSNFFTILLPDQTPGHFFGYESKSIAIPVELASDNSYITFQVFRI